MKAAEAKAKARSTAAAAKPRRLTPPAFAHLSPVAACLPRRSDKDIADAVRDDEARAHADDIARRIRECGVPAALLNADTFTADGLPDDARGTWARAANMLTAAGQDAVAQRHSLIALVAGRGCGKSTLAAAAVLRACKAQQVARYAEAWDYVQKHKTAARSFKETSDHVEAVYCRPPLLVLDESHALPPGYGDESLDIFRRLVMRRWNANLVTILVSNDTAEAFAGRVGESVVSRMQESGQAVVFDYADLRPRGRAA